MSDIVLPKMVASVTRDVALRRRTAELELCAASMFVCHVLARLFRVICFWPHQELQATSLKFAPRALCSAIVVSLTCVSLTISTLVVLSVSLFSVHILGCLVRWVAPTARRMLSAGGHAAHRPSDCSSLRLSTLHKKLATMIPGTTQLMAGAKRKCFQAAKDMDNIVEQTTLKQARALSRVLFAWMMDTVHLRRRAQRQPSSDLGTGLEYCNYCPEALPSADLKENA